MITINIVGGLEEKLIELAHQNGETPEETACQAIENAWFDTMREMDNYENEDCDHDTLLKSDAGEYRCRWCGRVIALAEVEVPF